MKRNKSNSPMSGGLSWPHVGGLWKRTSSGVLYEVVGGFPQIEIRAQDTDDIPLKLTDLAAFYREFKYQGKVKDDQHV